MKQTGFAALCAMCLVGTASAQDRPGPPAGWGWQVDGLTQWQGDTDLTGGGQFSVARGVLRGGAFHSWDTGVSAGLQVSLGRYDYRFRNVALAPWGDITDLRLSAPIRLAVGDRAQAIIVPSLRYDYESGAGTSGAQTWGVFAGISWQLSERLRLGPAFGAFTRLEDDELELFPALLVDWQMTDRWSLSTGGGLGATQGPGLTLGYAVTPDWTVALGVRRENIRFRLNGSGPAPGGVGEDSSTPIALTVSYEPHPGLSLTGFAGAEVNGVLRLDDAGGTTIRQERYDTAPMAGFAFRLRF